MESRDTFSAYNPLINFMFFIGAVVFGMFFVHPAFLLCSLILAFAYYINLRGMEGIRLLFAMVPLFLILSLISPLLNPNGDTVLFTYFGGRPYTLEALYYGMALAAMFISVIVWFASYNIVMTGDKFLYIFGRTAPAISLVLSMIMRLIPSFQKKAGEIALARECIGKAGRAGTRRERAENGMTVISALTTWALEGGIVTADSMRSRGYGAGRRTSFAVYRFDGRDAGLLTVLTVLASAVILCGIRGGMSYEAGAGIDMSNTYTLAGLAAYGLFLAVPTAINITEEIIWRILRSKI